MANIKEKSDAMRHNLAKSILKLMEQDGLNWKCGWNALAFAPHNGINNSAYRGINRANLALSAMLNGWQDQRWCTFHQASKKGWQIKKGEKASLVEKWGLNTYSKTSENEEGEMEEKLYSFLKLQGIYYVFNYQQLEGPEPETSSIVQEDVEQIADNLILSSACAIRECASGEAYYSLNRDEIVMPKRRSFKSSQAFMATLIHEMGHSTGHRTRLNREELMRGGFGSEKYAIEELRAEFNAIFTQASLGLNLEADNLENHAAYVKEWLKACKEDESLLFSAITDASKISDYLLENYKATVANKENNTVA